MANVRQREGKRNGVIGAVRAISAGFLKEKKKETTKKSNKNYRSRLRESNTFVDISPFTLLGIHAVHDTCHYDDTDTHTYGTIIFTIRARLLISFSSHWLLRNSPFRPTQTSFPCNI
jgi:hypothetical protein